MNKYPMWKNVMLVVLVVLSSIYAAPNFYPADPAIQISHDSGVVDQAAVKIATDALDADGIEWFGQEVDGGIALIRLRDQNDQGRAQQLINLALSQDYVVALNLAANTPDWLVKLGASPMSYGLDLQGGVHFMMEVDLEQALDKQLSDAAASMRGLLREERIRYRAPLTVDNQDRIVIRFTEEDARSAANTIIRTEFPDLMVRTAEAGNDYLLYFNMSEASIVELQRYAVQQNLTTLRSRVNELGVKEPKIQQVGLNRIVIELPGIQDTTRAKDLISAVATLQFHLVAGPGTPAGDTLQYDYQGQPYRLDANIIVGGESVTGAQTSIDPQTTLPQVNITLDAVGARRINEITRANIGKPMAILLSETKTRSETIRGPDGELQNISVPYVDERLISVATIQSALGRQFRITGLESGEAADLALLIRSGALAAPMHFVEESTVGPSLGQENIESGISSVLAGFALVVIFMTLVYRVSGMVANLALAINLLMLMALMSILGATLTLPGIAGIVLTLGMAVDANVLIYARVREELLAGASIHRALELGYDRAFVTILDSNLTTLIVVIILYAIGTGPVKGFAVTTAIGVITSMITAIMISRSLMNLIYGRRGVKRISIGLQMPKSAATA